jgi:hypothetical protein
MKQQNFNKKLQLNKTTITNLGNGEMRDLFGGLGPPSDDTCISIDIICQTTPTQQLVCPTHYYTCKCS